jgi:2-dehydro-3-deoxyphosphooctonate aldolase (KDO 8-P synthase)
MVDSEPLKAKLEGVFWGCVIASPFQVQEACRLGAQYLFIPGDVCRQADVLQAAKNSMLPLILQRGLFLPPLDFVRALDKVTGSQVLASEAGSSFGYGLPALDLQALSIYTSLSKPFALNYAELLATPSLSPWAPGWNSDVKQLETALECAHKIVTHLGASCFVANSEQAKQLLQNHTVSLALTSHFQGAQK